MLGAVLSAEWQSLVPDVKESIIFCYIEMLVIVLGILKTINVFDKRVSDFDR